VRPPLSDAITAKLFAHTLTRGGYRPCEQNCDFTTTLSCFYTSLLCRTLYKIGKYGMEIGEKSGKLSKSRKNWNFRIVSIDCIRLLKQEDAESSPG